MPFRLCNGPATFQSYINDTLREYLNEFCTAYIDNILIYLEDLATYRQYIKKVLERLRKAGLQVDISKCQFEAIEISFLGLIISTKGIRMDPSKVAAIATWPTPRSVKDVQRFLGFANFYRQFIPQFSTIATPLIALTKKDTPFKWSAECEAAFIRLKERFADGTLLIHYDPSKPYIVETDASDFVTAAVLSQYDSKGVLRPIAFMSKKMLP